MRSDARTVKYLVLVGAGLLALGVAGATLGSGGRDVAGDPPGLLSTTRAPATTSEATRDPDPVDLTPVREALARGRLDEAWHLLARLPIGSSDLTESLRLLLLITQARSESALRAVDGKDRNALKSSYNAARAATDEATALIDKSLVADRAGEGVLTPGAVASLIDSRRGVSRMADRTTGARRAAFNAFVWSKLEEVRTLYWDGKNWWNDDEEKFIEAVVPASYAFGVSDEVGELERTAVMDWANRLRSELNDSEWERAKTRAVVVVGTSPK